MSEIPNPKFAPKRRDITYLRHRRRSATPAKGGQATTSNSKANAPPPPPLKVTLVHPGRGQMPSPARERPGVPATPKSTATAIPNPSPVPAPVGTSLDLGSGASSVQTPPSTSFVLPGRGSNTKRTALPVRRARRASTGALTRLDSERPSATLTRLLSGVGALEVSLVGVEADRAALGCVYEAVAAPEPQTLVVDAESSSMPQPNQLLRGSFKRRQGIIMDLRQVARFRRALFYVITRSGNGDATSCALVLTTRGVDLIECPVDLPDPAGTVALATVYNALGELVVRSEIEIFDGPLRTAAQAHGFSLPYRNG